MAALTLAWAIVSGLGALSAIASPDIPEQYKAGTFVTSAAMCFFSVYAFLNWI